MTEVTTERLVAWIEGRVQGVGFRWWVRSRALELGLVGFAENLADGRVKVVAEGASGPLRDLLALLAGSTASVDGMLRPGRVTRVAHRWTDAVGDMSGFAER